MIVAATTVQVSHVPKMVSSRGICVAIARNTIAITGLIQPVPKIGPRLKMDGVIVQIVIANIGQRQHVPRIGTNHPTVGTIAILVVSVTEMVVRRGTVAEKTLLADRRGSGGKGKVPCEGPGALMANPYQYVPGPQISL